MTVASALAPLADAFDALGVAYHVGGSVASSARGIARATLDVDVVAALRLEHRPSLIERLAGEYYVDEGAVRRAVEQESSFNAIHLASMIKIDVFVPGADRFEQAAMARASSGPLEGGVAARSFPIATTEDMIIKKLRWYRSGGEVSRRQWKDVQGMLRVVGGGLDRPYLERWADELGLRALLDRALGEALS